MGLQFVNSHRIAWLKMLLMASRIFSFVPPCKRSGLPVFQFLRGQRLKPLFYRHGFDGPQFMFAPVRQDPPPQQQFLSVLGRMRFAFIASVSQFVKGVMLHCFDHGN